MMRVLILSGLGFNCHEETAHGYAVAGAQPTICFAGDLLSGACRLDGYDLLHLPGGFSFGDDLGSGQVFANRLRHGQMADGAPLWPEIVAFLRRGGKIVGICNGFQILVRCGLVPNIGGAFEPEASLCPNESGRFEDRWVTCRAAGRTDFGTATLELPVRHGEGRLVFGSEALRREAFARGLVVLQYCDPAGDVTTVFPHNPNGSADGVAGLLSADGQVVGMMPHPEAFLTLWNHPAWAVRLRNGAMREADEADGARVMRALLNAPAGEVQS